MSQVCDALCRDTPGSSPPEFTCLAIDTYHVAHLSHLAVELSSFPRNTRGQTIAHLNIQGISKKTDELRYQLTRSEVKLLFLSETFLKPHNASCMYSVEGYHNERLDRDTGHGGGILAFIHNSISYERLYSLDSLLPESMAIKVCNRNAKPYICIVVYRPPSSPASWISRLDACLLQARSICAEVTLMGDFNMDILDYTPTSLVALSAAHDLTQLIQEPTRVTLNTSTLIDHLYTSNEENIIGQGVVPLGLSDHYMIFCTRKVGNQTVRPSQRRSTRDWSRFDLEAYQKSLARVPWYQINKLDDPSHMVDMFYQQLSRVVDTHAPMRVSTRSVGRRPVPRWFDQEIRLSIKERDRMKRINDPQYRKMRNKTTALIRAKKRTYTAELIDNTPAKDTRKLWNHLLNRENGSAASTVEAIREPSTGDIVSDDKEKAECLNNHFSNVAKQLLDSQGHRSSGDQPFARDSLAGQQSSSDCSNGIPHITPDEVIVLICKLSTNKATGLDGLSVKLLQQSLPHIAPPVATIINQSIQQGIFPQQWKEARVTPLHKGGDKTDPSHYRPISVLPVLSKLFERHIKSALSSHLDSLNILHPHQSGFRSGHSCETAIMRMHADWSQSRKENKTTAIIMLDFSKAFDVVSHQILIDKLCAIQTPSQMIRLLSSYLSNRTQRVGLNNSLSRPKKITHGVPQGSILGPLLFAIYINDLLALPISSVVHAFADDTTLYYAHTDPDTVISTLNEDLATVRDWCETNQMVINVEKTKYMLIAPKRQKLVPNIDAPVLRDIAIKKTDKTRLLGFTITADLAWRSMIQQLHRKARTNVSLLRHLRHLIDNTTARTFYSQHILPYLTQGLTLWGNLESKKSYNTLYLVQKSALRCINNVKIRDKVNTANLADNTHILLLPELLTYHTASLAFKVALDIAPVYITDMFPKRPERDRRDTRKLASSSYHSKLTQQVCNVFNALPPHLRQSASQASFRCRLRCFLFEKY